MTSTQDTPYFNSKLPHLGTTIFTVMSALAREQEAINLSQGFPDFDCDPNIIDLVTHYMKSGANQYAPMSGVLPLREAIAEAAENLYGCILNPETEITITSGASESIFNALACVIRPGDEVIILEPAYDLYKPVTELFGGQIVAIPMEVPSYRVNWDQVEAAITERTRLIMVNTPHNPSGTILREADMRRLAEIVRNRNIFVISDEVYEHIVFDQEFHASVLRYPELRERSFAVFSFGKTFHATGWRIGYCIAPATLSREFRKIHQFNTFATFTPAQFALADFMRNADNYLNLRAFFQERRDKFRALMQETPFQLLECEGTYFQLASYGHLSDEKDQDYCVRLTKEVGVATIPLSPFYATETDHSIIRFCFAKKHETLERAVERLVQYEDRLGR
ncbi:MAG: methionine aminotransferase [Microscillaceae bacterium]|nr:methionine aminotransferase [Microscillaceae bacterium]